FGHESALRQRFAAAVESAFQTAAQRSRVRAVMSLVVMALVFGAVVVILWIGGHDVLNGRLTGGALSAFVVYAVLVAGAVAALSEIAGDVQRA
ncbi:ABC transporter transmembrane domain-containing protein, partial [Acinetobacter baumannii]